MGRRWRVSIHLASRQEAPRHLILQRTEAKPGFAPTTAIAMRGIKVGSWVAGFSVAAAHNQGTLQGGDSDQSRARQFERRSRETAAWILVPERIAEVPVLADFER
jgi:hypothetical protein